MTIQKAQAVLKFRMNLLSVVANYFGGNEQIHDVEFKIRNIPPEKLQEVLKSAGLPETTAKEALATTVKNIITRI